MNRRRSFLAVLTVAAILAAGSAVYGAENSLTAEKVDVYPRGALLSIKMDAEPRMQIELPLTLDPGNITVTAGEGVKVQGYDIVEVARPGWIPPALASLAGELDKARSRVDILRARATALEQAMKHLGEAVPEGLNGAELETYVDTAVKKRESVELKAAETEALLELAGKEHDLLKSEYENQFPGDPDRVLLLSVETEGKGKIVLDAWTRDAYWRPAYRMGLNSSTGEVTVKLAADVSQKSGITWNGEILLHTVRPKGGINIPEMRPLVVDFLEISPAPKAMRGAMEEMAASVMMDEAAPQEPLMEEGLTDVTLKARGIVNGFGKKEMLELGGFSEKSDVSLVAIPEFSSEAWTVATVKSIGRAILPGEARLSVDGNETGVTAIPRRSMGQELKIPFGTTPLVTSKREEMLPEKGSSWIIRGKHQRGYVITVSNGLREKVTLKVMDRIPVPARDNIKLQDLAVSPDPAEKIEKGLVTWNVELEKGQSSEITVKYTVTYPADKELIFR
jgi:uncharacterized protein (TIGR02231 family)